MKADAPVLYVDKSKPGYDCTVSKPSRWCRLSELDDGCEGQHVLFKDGVRCGCRPHAAHEAAHRSNASKPAARCSHFGGLDITRRPHVPTCLVSERQRAFFVPSCPSTHRFTSVCPTCRLLGSPGDIKQGDIGTCWLLGAMGSVAGTDGKKLAKLFVRYDFDVGVFGVRFFLDGEWTYVLVDDFLPAC